MQDKLKADYKTKGVTFNLSDPDQLQLFKYAMQRQNFSGYVKRLIQRDFEQQDRKNPAVVKTANGGIKLDLT
jgi:hypothetical protein